MLNALQPPKDLYRTLRETLFVRFVLAVLTPFTFLLGTLLRSHYRKFRAAKDVLILVRRSMAMAWSSLVPHALAVAAVCLSWGDSVVADGEEPGNAMCRYVAKDSLSFCSMVDYMAVVDADDPTGARFDVKAEFYYRNVDIVLQRFGCHAKYSVYGCDDCREAYKYWVCSIKFQKCGSQTVTTDRGATKLQYNTDVCDYTTTATSTATTTSKTTCVEGSSGRYRTCLSICEDVVRKCPYVLNFQCPTVRPARQTSFEGLDCSLRVLFVL
uniref:FZ domain-containing protein n=1 Tax=Phytophthora ramorum TaxID=164328 RepID=H3GX91_PHYRM